MKSGRISYQSGFGNTFCTEAEKGALPSGKTYPVKRSALAEVKARYHTSGEDSTVTTRNYPVVGGVVNSDLFIEEPLGSPATRVEYFSPGAWYNEGSVGRFGEGSALWSKSAKPISTTKRISSFGSDTDVRADSWSNLRVEKFAPGRKYDRAPLRGIAAPRLGKADAPWPHGGGVSRQYPHLEANVSPFGTSKAVEGRVRNSSLTMELKRDGVSLGTDFLYNSRFYAPARDGRFTLDLHATRNFVALSPEVRDRLSRALGSDVNERTSDGVVPTLSMVWERLLWCGAADHLDVLGHFHDEFRPTRHTDWLTSGADFGRPQFWRMMDTLVRFQLETR